MNLHTLAAKYRLGLVSADDLPKVGIDALTDGLDTPSLRLLAGESSSDCEEARRLFEKSLIELGIAIPTLDEAGIVVSRSIAQEVIDGKLDPYEGASRIWDSVYVHNPRLEALTVFVGLASELDDHPEERESYLAEIVKECRLLVESQPSDSTLRQDFN
jgi:hypothetical protein